MRVNAFGQAAGKRCKCTCFRRPHRSAGSELEAQKIDVAGDRLLIIDPEGPLQNGHLSRTLTTRDHGYHEVLTVLKTSNDDSEYV